MASSPIKRLMCLVLLQTIPKGRSFQYKLPAQEITAPEMFCFSGDAIAQRRDRSRPCPNTPEEVENYPAVVMDEAGYVTVKIENVMMRDDGRRRHDILLQKNEEDAVIYGRDTGNRRLERDESGVDDEEANDAASPEDQRVYQHHLQVYLVALDEYSDMVNTSQCCYELEIHSGDGKSLPDECLAPRDDKASFFVHDYRIHAPRVGQSAALSAPMTVNSYDTSIDMVAKLRPTSRGRHMVVLSNCAAEITVDPYTNATVAKGIKAVMQNGLEIVFVSKFGELPLSMMGIIPFYGILAAFYGLLASVWRYKAHAVGYYAPASMLGLQRAIKYLVLSQFVFCAIAFVYYLHLNETSVDVEVLYSGTAAALVNWGPLSILVALAHFGTIFGCQCVVTLATDGTWLIQNTVRTSTKRALYILCALWIVYFCIYGILSIKSRRRIFAIGGFVWIAFLMFNLHRSLKHLRSLMVGQSEDVVLAIGGAIVAKRSLYRKMFVIVGVYPLVFLGSLLLTSWQSREDSWAWVGYVLGDLYLFVILLHASYIWMPRPMASQEYVKYAPLEVGVTNDSEMWEDGNLDGEHWEEEDEVVELELS